MDRKDYKYVIVGAGISGVHCALILAQNNIDFVVLQASNRIGGRICTTTIGEALAQDGTPIDYPWLKNIQKIPVQKGATWVCQDQTLVYYFFKRYGMNIFEQFYQTKHIMAVDKNKFKKMKDMTACYQQYRPKILKLFKVIDELEQKFDALQEKWQKKTITAQQKTQFYEMYKKYDTMSAHDFMLQIVEDEFLAKLLGKQAGSLEGTISQYISVFHLLGYNSPLKNLRYYMGYLKYHVDGFRVERGMERLVQGMLNQIQTIFDAEGKGKKLKDVFLVNQPVTKIQNSKQPVVVQTKTCLKLTCHKVFLCLPAATANFIDYQQISKGKKIYIQNQLPSRITRMYVIFPKPFWRKQFSGYVILSHNFDLTQFVDVSPKNEQCGIVGLVFADNQYKRWTQQVLKQCDTLEGDKLKKQFYEKNKRKALDLIADMFLNGDRNSQHLRQAAFFTRSMSDYHYIRASYQSSTRPNTVLKILEAGQNFQEARTGNQKNMVVLGSDFSHGYDGYIQGALYVARNKTYKEIGVQDPLKIQSKIAAKL